MARGKEIRQLRADDTLKILMEKSKCIFLTLTTPDIVSYDQVRERWRNLRHWLIRRLGKPKYIMNYELHPKGHGWHIHAVLTSYIPLSKYLDKIQSFGFGRVGVEVVYNRFVSDYLTKHCLKSYRGINKKYKRYGDFNRMRLVNQSRGLPPLSDYEYRSDYMSSLREVSKILKPRVITSRKKLLLELPYYFGFAEYDQSLQYFQELLYQEINNK
jgi:hypothetical protein